MPYTNPFFSNTTGYSTENSLIDDLVTEQIAMFGIDILYMPRKHLNLDQLLHEGSKSAFEFAMPIPMYMKSFSGYQNGMELLTKFGVRSSDEITMVMSRSQFITYYAPYIKSYYQEIEGLSPEEPLDKNKGMTDSRPKEGDLIYFPFDDGIFEIKYVMFDQPFFQLGQGYVFEIQCEKFEYSGETFSTGYPDIDDSMVKPDYYRIELEVKADGLETFEVFEDVKIYDVSSPTSGEDTLDFGLFKDVGYLDSVPYVTAKVMEWNKTKNKLTIGDISDLDPDQIDTETGDVTINKFDSVLVIGDKSGAMYYTVKATDMETAFNDSFRIQNEFHDIKILDPGDENPFGFI